MIFACKGNGVDIVEAQGGIVIAFEDEGVTGGEVADMVEGRGGGEAGHFEGVVIDVFLGGGVGLHMIVGVEGVDEVGLTLLEHFRGNVPLLRDELVWDVKAGEDEVEHLDVVAGGLTLVVQELEGLEVPVAHDNEWLFIGVAVGLLGGYSE